MIRNEPIRLPLQDPGICGTNRVPADRIRPRPGALQIPLLDPVHNGLAWPDRLWGGSRVKCGGQPHNLPPRVAAARQPGAVGRIRSPCTASTSIDSADADDAAGHCERCAPGTVATAAQSRGLRGGVV